MKVAIAVGFYDPVLVQLKIKFATQLAKQQLVWISTVGPHGDGDIRNFKSILFDRLSNGATEVVVFAAVRRGRDQFRDELDAVIGSARTRHTQVVLDVRRYSYAQAEFGEALESFFDTSNTDVDAVPEKLSELEDWFQQTSLIRERVLILPSAMREVVGSAFEDVGLVYRSLLLLASEYWELRAFGGPEKKRRWDEGLDRLGLKVAPSISKTSSGKQKLEYYVNYPIGSPPGNARFLEQHLKKGADRDQRYCFRVYFFWDKKLKLVVVGWLPSHLDTNMT